MTTVEDVVAAHAAIATAEQRYRQLLREALKVRGNQARLVEALGLTRETLRTDAMSDEDRAELRAADAERKAKMRERAKQVLDRVNEALDHPETFAESSRPKRPRVS